MERRDDAHHRDDLPATTGKLTLGTEPWGAGGFLLTVTGDLDHHTTTQLTDWLQTVLERPAPTVLVDLSRVALIDSSGLTCLLQADRAVRGAGGHLALVAPSPRVQRLMDITGLGQVFTTYPDHRVAQAAHDRKDPR
ncbi:STAS domain-containing protein [Streptomyces sp. NPDC054834]